MKTKTSNIVVAGLASLLLAGCSVGMAPEGSTEQAKKEIEAMPLDKQIAFIKSGPMPPAEKERLIKEAKEKAGVPVDGTEKVSNDPSVPAH